MTFEFTSVQTQPAPNPWAVTPLLEDDNKTKNPPTPAPPQQPNSKTPFPQWCFDLEIFVCSLWRLCPPTCIADAESVLEVSARATWESALVQLSGESHSLLEISTCGHHRCKHSLALKSGWLSWSNKRGFSPERRRTRQAGWISPLGKGFLQIVYTIINVFQNSFYHPPAPSPSFCIENQ